MKIQRTINKKTTHTIVIDRVDLVKLLQTEFPNLPKDANVCVPVPSGADYSGLGLEIGMDSNIIVTWTKEEIKNG